MVFVGTGLAAVHSLLFQIFQKKATLVVARTLLRLALFLAR